MKKLIVVLGPTASGKSKLAVKLALRLSSGQAKKNFKIEGAEIVSADSRQVYKGMDIGTGKITKKEMMGVPHHLLDVASPKRRFTVVQYRQLALAAIEKIQEKNKIPILCGGTGFYIQAIVEGIVIPRVLPDWNLRKKLGKKSSEELYHMLKKMDPRRAKTIEKKNPRRLIRAIEIVLKTRGPVPRLKQNPLPYPVLTLGIKKTPEELKKLIKKRLLIWLKEGLIKEVKKIKNSGLSWEEIEEFGIHYKVISQYLQKKVDYKEMQRKSLKELQNYAKRQLTWFKRDKRIYWVENYRDAPKKSLGDLTGQAEKLVKEFLKKNEGE